MVVHRYSQNSLGWLLANHIVVKVGFDFCWRWQITALLLGSIQAWQLVTDDFIAQVNALVANENRRPCDEFFDFVLALTAEGAVERFFARSAFFINHVLVCVVYVVSFRRAC